MLDVLIALVPALAVTVTFGARALIHVVIAMVASLVFDHYNKIVHHPNTVGDLSCLVTGITLSHSTFRLQLRCG